MRSQDHIYVFLWINILTFHCSNALPLAETASALMMWRANATACAFARQDAAFDCRKDINWLGSNQSTS